jgi:amylosucrase
MTVFPKEPMIVALCLAQSALASRFNPFLPPEQQLTLSLDPVRHSQASRLGRRASGAAWQAFNERLTAHFPALLRELSGLYGQRADFLLFLDGLMATAWQGWSERPADLRALDVRREANPDWIQSKTMLGGVCYVDLFCGDLRGVIAQIPYFKELGLTYGKAKCSTARKGVY